MTKILVVEDEEIVRSNILQFLENENYELDEAESGVDALNKIEKSVPDLIISDIMMPGMDGYELVKRIQTNPATADIPIILLTARADNQDVRRGMEFGADDYITKPFKGYELIEAVKTRLKKKENYKRKFEELKSNISLYIPHELRTPLVSIIGFADLLTTSLNDLEHDEICEMAVRVKGASLKLYDRIEKFIYFSELELSKSEKSNEAKFKIKEHFISSLLKTKFKDKKTDIIDISIEESEVVILDDYFIRILIELIENAFKFTGNKPEIKVTGKTKGNKYIFVVEDNGRGMSQNEVNQIQVFRQFKREVFQQEGNGLGLAIVKNILNIIDGKLEIESDGKTYTKVQIILNKT